MEEGIMITYKSHKMNISGEIPIFFLEWCEENIPGNHYEKIRKNIEGNSEQKIVYSYTIKSIDGDENKLPDATWFLNNNLVSSYSITLTCPGAEEDSDEEAYFEIYKNDDGDWRIGIGLEDIAWIEPGKGMARLIITLLVYKTYAIFDHHDVIGICADTSGGFWEYLGMKEGRFSEQGSRVRKIRTVNSGLPLTENAISRQICGYDKEFTYHDLLQWVGYGKSKKPKKRKLNEEVGLKKKKPRRRKRRPTRGKRRSTRKTTRKIRKTRRTKRKPTRRSRKKKIQ